MRRYLPTRQRFLPKASSKVWFYWALPYCWPTLRCTKRIQPAGSVLIASMERAASFDGQDTTVIRSLLDIIRGVLLNEFQDHMSIADWLQNADFAERCLPPAMAVSALFVHLSFLMHQGEFARVIGTVQAIRPAEGLLSPYGDLFACFLMAISHMALGNRAQAAAFVEHAARKALPDGLVSPFAAYSGLLRESD
jgi:LuxR family maltose regulon positive regulatory protein